MIRTNENPKDALLATGRLAYVELTEQSRGFVLAPTVRGGGDREHTRFPGGRQRVPDPAPSAPRQGRRPRKRQRREKRR